MARNELPEDKISRLMRGTTPANGAPASGGNVTHIRLDGRSTYIGGDVIFAGRQDGWAELRAEQARCRGLITEIDRELDSMTAPELRQALDWIRRHISAS